MLSSSSHSIGAAPEKTTCIIILLEGEGKIYAKDLAPDERMDNCIIVPFELLQELQPHLAGLKIFKLKKLIKNHLKLTSKICVKDMGAFGKGAFGKQKIQAADAIIYTGRIIKNDKSITSDSIIRLVPDGFTLDGSPVRGLAKLFQHLPASVDNHNAGIATENFNSTGQCVKFTYQHKSYLLPIITLDAKKDIEPDTMLGYDYGAAYWTNLEKAFTFFTPAGKPVQRYCLRINDSKSDFYLYLNPLIAKTLVTDAHINLADGLHLLPADSFNKFKADFETTKIQEGTTLIDLQSVFELKLDKYMERKRDRVKIAVLINDKEKASADDEVLKYFKIDIVEHDNKKYLFIPISSLTQASTQELIGLVNYLKTKVSSKCKLLQTQPLSVTPSLSVVNHSMFKPSEAKSAPVMSPIEDAACNARPQ